MRPVSLCVPSFRLLMPNQPEAAAAAVKSAEITAAMNRVRQIVLCEARFLSPVR